MQLLCPDLRAQLARAALRWKYPRWRIVISDAGRWWAFTDHAQFTDRNGIRHTGMPDAADADNPRDLAAELRRRAQFGRMPDDDE